MRVHLDNALSSVASPGVSRNSLERLDEQVADAHGRIARGRTENAFGYAALNLPDRTDPSTVEAAVERVPAADTVLTVGIGGSALGATTLSTALDPGIEHHALDNVDPAWVGDVLDRVDLDETVVHVVSRSGTTAETLANFLVVRDRMDDAGVDWTGRTIVTTGDAGPLRRLADSHDLPALPVPDGVPGRFSALSSVGLVPLALGDADLEALLAGASDLAGDLAGSLFECPPYAYGATAVALSRRGASVNAMMPYAESLEPFAEWFAQLWAESLGKDGLGQAPLRAMGVTDQHSQLQRYRAGPRNTMVTFVRPCEREAVEIPRPDETGGADEGNLAYLDGATLGQLIDAEFVATEASLREAGRPNVRIELDHVDERGVGELLYGMEAACVLAGELAGVNAFDQPAVEWGKRRSRELLREGANDENGSDLVVE